MRTLFIAVAMLALATRPSDAGTITYNFAARIGVAVANVDFTLESVQTGDVLHGAITIDTSLPDLSASPDIGDYVATAVPSVLSLTIGPFGAFPQEIYSTSTFSARIAENGSGFFGAEELLFMNDVPFLAAGHQVDQFEVRLDSDNLSFLNGTGFPAAVDLGLLNGHSTFAFNGHDPSSVDGFEFLGSITQFDVATDAVPEPASGVLVGGGVLALAARRRQGQH